jgi:two-component system, chemotaxis family, sensor kinase CheA
MPGHDQSVIREFLVESHENLLRLDQELVELEKRPRDAALLAGMSRNFRTIKGTCGFLAFSRLQRLTHQAESLLSLLHDGEQELSPSLVSLILETVDATRKALTSIERCGEEGPDCFEDLTERLRVAAQPTPRAARQQYPKPANAAPDNLMDLVGELVLTRNQILQYNTGREDAVLNATSQRLNLIIAELQKGVVETRVAPDMPAALVALDKQIRLEKDRAETDPDPARTASR